MKRLLAAFATTMAAWCGNASAAIYSDLWYNPSESGWGVNIIQQRSTLFMTLFVYGTDNRPKWFVTSAARPTGQTSSSGGPIYSGDLLETNGSPFSGTFNPSATTFRRVGTITFTPSSFARGQLSYTVDGATVTKAIQRQTWEHIPLGGRFRGALVVSSVTSGCTPSAANTPGAVVNIGLNVTANTSNSSVSLALTDTSNTICTFNGTYQQFGAVYQFNTTNVGCNGTWTFTDYVAEDDGISGNINLVNGACTWRAAFAAVRLPQ